MPSAKILEQKQKMVEELAEKIKNAGSGVLVNYCGITVMKDTALREVSSGKQALNTPLLRTPTSRRLAR